MPGMTLPTEAVYPAPERRGDKDSVDFQSAAYARQLPSWMLVEDLSGGTFAMRAATEKWLPKEPKEDRRDYQSRLNRSVLYAAFSDTVERLAGRPFTKSITVNGLEGTRLEGWDEDVDGTGRSLTQFGREALATAIRYGHVHCLVDAPRRDPDAERPTLADPIPMPRAILVEPVRMLGAKRAEGNLELTQVRILERIDEPDGSYGDQLVEHVRVYKDSEWELHRKDPETKEWALFTGPESHTFKGVPFATLYTRRVGFMESEPPLEDLAWLNVAHWQSFSDQRSVLRVSRFGLLFAKGFPAEELEKGDGLVVGPSRLIQTEAKDASLSYVEHDGKAIGAGEKDLERLEERMEVLGLQPLIRRTGGVTATGRALDEANASSDVQAWIRAEEMFLREIIEMAFRWVQEDVPEDLSVDIYNEFGITLRAQQDAESLLQLRATGQITHATLLREFQRRGIISADIDIDEEITAVADETVTALQGLADIEDEDDAESDERDLEEIGVDET